MNSTRIIIGLLFAVACGMANAATRLGTDTEAPPQRIALLIGNTNYDHLNTLKNPKNDVDEMAKKLGLLGFQTVVKYDLKHDDFVLAVSDFENQIAPGAIALFYYSGHGVQVSGTNYLIPTNMPKAPSENTIEGIGISLPSVRRALNAARLSLIILDACRTAPVGSLKGTLTGLAPFSARGALVAYAADEDQAADDNDAESISLFTKFLLQEFDKQNETLCEFFSNVRQAVDTASQHVQFPFVYDGVIGEFVFNRSTTTALKEVIHFSDEVAVWKRVQAADDPNYYAAALSPEAPKSKHVKFILDRLREQMSDTVKATGVIPLKAESVPPELVPLGNQASRLFYEGAYVKAVKEYESLLQQRQNDPVILYDYGTCLVHLGRYADAIKAFTQALAIDSNLAWAANNRGVANHLLGNVAAATSDYSEAIIKAPSTALLNNNLAVALRQHGELDEAKSHVQTAINLDPAYAPAFFNNAEIYDGLGDKAAASDLQKTGERLTIPMVANTTKGISPQM